MLPTNSGKATNKEKRGCSGRSRLVSREATERGPTDGRAGQRMGSRGCEVAVYRARGPRRAGSSALTAAAGNGTMRRPVAQCNTRARNVEHRTPNIECRSEELADGHSPFAAVRKGSVRDPRHSTLGVRCSTFPLSLPSQTDCTGLYLTTNTKETNIAALHYRACRFVTHARAHASAYAELVRRGRFGGSVRCRLGGQ